MRAPLDDGALSDLLRRRVDSGPVQVAFLLIDEFALMSYASIIEPLRTANFLAHDAIFEFLHFSVGGAPIASSAGSIIRPDRPIGHTGDFDILFIISGANSPKFKDLRVFRWLREVAASGIMIAGIAGAPLLLARAGLMHGCRCTIHRELCPSLVREFPDIEVEQSLYVVDGSRITCAGGSAGFELAADLLEQRCGRDMMLAVREWHQFAPPRSADTPQRLGAAVRFRTNSIPIIKALAHMEANIEDPSDRRSLSEAAGVSIRGLEQLFRTHLDTTLGETYNRIRLSHAYWLLRTSGISVTEAAVAAGFTAPSHFSRRFKRQFGICAKALKARTPMP